MIEFEVAIKGSFREQPLLGKAGCIAAFIAFVVFGGFVPVALAVGVALGVGTPAPNWKGTAGAIAFTVLMEAIGAWVNLQGLNWLLNGMLSLRGGCLFVAGTVIVSAGIALIAAMLHVWPPVMVIAGIIVLAGLLGSFILIRCGNSSRVFADE